MTVFVNPSVPFYHKHARYGEDCMLFKKGKRKVVCWLVS